MQPVTPPITACSGVLVTGTMVDSLTGKPVAQGLASLQTGTQLSPSLAIDNFVQTQQATAKADGSFSLCASSITQPAVVVLLALDASAKSYPAFVGPVNGNTSLGTIPMGACTGACGFPGQQQTAVPATIRGVVTSTPLAEAGTVTPQYTLSALDGTKALWNIALPNFNPSQGNTFTTAAGSCPGGTPYCASYSFSVPSLSPVTRTSTGYKQSLVTPTYSIYAALSTPGACKPPFALTVFQSDGVTPLTAAPGAQLTAASLNFSACQ